MKRPLTFLLKNDLYPFAVGFWVGRRPTDREFGVLAKRYDLWSGTGLTPSPGNGRGGTCQFQSGSMVWIDDAGFNESAMECFAHEIVHVLSNASRVLGQPLNHETDEFHAYLAGWIAKRFVQEVRRRRG